MSDSFRLLYSIKAKKRGQKRETVKRLHFSFFLSRLRVFALYNMIDENAKLPYLATLYKPINQSYICVGFSIFKALQ